jgi:hypothetical protein
MYKTKRGILYIIVSAGGYVALYRHIHEDKFLALHM